MDIRVTDVDVEKWKKRIRKLDDEVEKLHRERDLLKSRLAALPLFASNGHEDSRTVIQGSLESIEIADEPDGEGIATLSLPAAVRMVLTERPNHFTKADLKRELVRRGIPQAKLGEHNNYYYTVLVRLRNDGALAWDRKGRLSVRMKESTAEEMTAPTEGRPSAKTSN
jgi:hypothetical protein